MRLKNIGGSHKGYTHISQKPFRDLAAAQLPKVSLTKELMGAKYDIVRGIELTPALQDAIAQDPQAAMAPLLEVCAAWKKELVEVERLIKVDFLMLSVQYQKSRYAKLEERARAAQNIVKLEPENPQLTYDPHYEPEECPPTERDPERNSDVHS